MGNARWSADDWSAYASTVKSTPRAAVFANRRMDAAYDPKTIAFRESRDGPLNPKATPIVVALDVTGSMGEIPRRLVAGNLGTLMGELLARRPVSDPHLMFMAVGDVQHDQAPLQVTQFEADLTIADQLRALFLEGGGGGNQWESYNLPWYFAAHRTRSDAWDQRAEKGYLFTLGDEGPAPTLTAAQARKVFGADLTWDGDLTPAALLHQAQQRYHVFHLIIEQGSHYQAHGPQVLADWRALLGQHVIPVSDIERLSEVIVATIQAHAGEDRAAVAASWSGDTALVVARALQGLTAEPSTGLVSFA